MAEAVAKVGGLLVYTGGSLVVNGLQNAAGRGFAAGVGTGIDSSARAVGAVGRDAVMFMRGQSRRRYPPTLTVSGAGHPLVNGTYYLVTIDTTKRGADGWDEDAKEMICTCSLVASTPATANHIGRISSHFSPLPDAPACATHVRPTLPAGVKMIGVDGPPPEWRLLTLRRDIQICKVTYKFGDLGWSIEGPMDVRGTTPGRNGHPSRLYASYSGGPDDFPPTDGYQVG